MPDTGRRPDAVVYTVEYQYSNAYSMLVRTRVGLLERDCTIERLEWYSAMPFIELLVVKRGHTRGYQLIVRLVLSKPQL